MDNWIPVKERLPEPGERVLVAIDNFVAEAFVNKSGVWMRNGFELDWFTPTHWMPLPEPPEKGGDVEPVELIVSGLEKRSASELAALLTKSQKFCKMKGDENNGKF